MDKSLEYIKMCLVAKEIQKIWEIADGDFYTTIKRKYKTLSYKILILNDWESRHEIIDHRSLFFWIPRLDQIQDMIDWTKWECRIIKKAQFEMHYKNISGEEKGTFVCGKTMEQLWLTFVMSERYSKAWDSENEEWETT